MTPGEELESLRAENLALNEQVKVLARVEQRLFKSQKEINAQLVRIRALADLALHSAHGDTEEMVVGRILGLLKSLFYVDCTLCLKQDHATGKGRAWVEPGPGRAVEIQAPLLGWIRAAPPVDVQAFAGLVEDPRVRALLDLARELDLPGELDTGGCLAALIAPAPGNTFAVFAWKSLRLRKSLLNQPLEPGHAPFLHLVAGFLRRSADNVALTRALSDSLSSLRKSEADLKRAERIARFGNWEIDLTASRVRGSDRTDEILGLAPGEFGLETISKISLPECKAALDQAWLDLVQEGKPYDVEFRVQRPSDGRIIDIHSIAEFDVARGVVYGVLEDITERKRAEEERQLFQRQLQHTHKMESLGSLAGGIAHDMNNVLGAILGLASAHLETLPVDSPAYRAMDTISKASIRGGRMVRSLLSFARQGLAEERELDLNAIIREEVSLLERTTLSRVRLELDLTPELRLIRGDASALTHALMNLCVNSVDAMPERGTLTLRSRNVDSDWIEVQVEDTGSGMPREVLEKALDPFFTTKPQGDGTGLGLSIVFNTVKAHKGQMEIHSEPGRGTRVLLRFPAIEPSVPAPESVLEPRSEEFHGTLKVLLVDDDELIQCAMQPIMDALGYSLAIASSGEEALAKLESGLQPDVVLLDMNMPGLGGIGTLPRLRALRPTLPVLLSTGRADQTALDLAYAHPGVTLLSKPFSMDELKKQLESVGRSRPSA